MQAVLDAVGAVAGGLQAQVRILEVASLGEIAGALARTSTTCCTCRRTARRPAVELEDEDGDPVPVDRRAADGRAAGRPGAGAADRAVVLLGRGGRARDGGRSGPAGARTG